MITVKGIPVTLPTHEELQKLYDGPAVAATVPEKGGAVKAEKEPTLAELEARADATMASFKVPPIASFAAPARGWRTMNLQLCLAACRTWNNYVLEDTRMAEDAASPAWAFYPSETRWSLYERRMNIKFNNLVSEATRHRIGAVDFPCEFITIANRALLDAEQDQAILAAEMKKFDVFAGVL